MKGLEHNAPHMTAVGSGDGSYLYPVTHDLYRPNYELTQFMIQG